MRAWLIRYEAQRYNSLLRALTYINLLIIGQVCMGFGGDKLTQTSYYYIKTLFNIRTPESFDMFLTNSKLSNLKT